MSPRSQVTNVYAAEAVQLMSYMRHTGTASSVPHGNKNWISKPSDASFLPVGRMVQTITNPTIGSIDSCVLTQPRARSPAPKVNATSRVLTDSFLTTSVAPAAQQPPASANLATFVAPAAQQLLTSANLATAVAPAAQQPPASDNLAPFVAPAA